VYGYISSVVQNKPRYDEPEFREFLHRYQRDCLLFGKNAATRRMNERQSSIWEKKMAGESAQ